MDDVRLPIQNFTIGMIVGRRKYMGLLYLGPDTILGSPGLRHKYATGLPSRYHRYGAILRLEENHLPL